MPLTNWRAYGPVRLQLVPDGPHSSCKLGGRPRALLAIFEIGMGGARRAVGRAKGGPLADDRQHIGRTAIRLGLHGAHGILTGLVEPWVTEVHPTGLGGCAWR
jgi:hypothetical protein